MGILLAIRARRFFPNAGSGRSEYMYVNGVVLLEWMGSG